MGSEEAMRELILRFTEDPEWLPSVSHHITDAIHAELADVNTDPELRASTYASTDRVLRLILDLARAGRPPSEAAPPPAALDYEYEFVRLGLPVDSLPRAYHIGQATFFRRWATETHETITDPQELTDAVELGANWIGSHGDDHVPALEHAHLDVRSSPTVLAAFGSPGVGVAGFVRSHGEAFSRPLSRS
jgi:hypothetical protein